MCSLNHHFRRHRFLFASTPSEEFATWRMHNVALVQQRLLQGLGGLKYLNNKRLVVHYVRK